MAAYKKALELDAGNEDAMTGLATVYADLGDNKAAADMLQKVADKDPNPRSLTSLASVYEQLKDYSLAAEMLRRALRSATRQFRFEARVWPRICCWPISSTRL